MFEWGRDGDMRGPSLNDRDTERPIVCAWCGKVIRPGASGVVSHGMCGPCAREQHLSLYHPRDVRRDG